MNTGLNPFELLVGDLSGAGAILTHEAVVNAEIASEGADIEHRVIFKERCDVKAEFYFFVKKFGNIISDFIVLLKDFVKRVEKILPGFLYRITGADELHLIAGGVIGYI